MKVYYLGYRQAIRKTARWLLVLLAIVLLLKMIQYSYFKPVTTNLEPIYQGNLGQKKIALTCNVVWGEEYVSKMLEILKKNDVKMTFFVGGQWVKDFPQLTKAIAEKHEIGNHSFSHPHPTFISKQANIDEIKKTEQIVYKTTGVTTFLYAPPYGEFNKTVLEASYACGYRMILWSIDTRDWQRPAPETIINRVLNKLHNGAIVLIHPTDPTVKALPELISELKKRGYTITTVSDVLGKK
jgi:probable sporulation protein (polysaccharide deacetylase family)